MTGARGAVLGGRTARVLLLVVALGFAREAEAERPPTYLSSGPEKNVLLELHATAGTGSFDRNQLGCTDFVPPGSNDDDVLGEPCGPARSDEVFVGFGLGMGFEVFEPVFLTWGLDVAQTEPSSYFGEPQTYISMPFGIQVTWSRWTLRPIAEAVLTPFVFIPDGTRGVTAGARLGGAVRIGDLDLALTFGLHHAAEAELLDGRISLLHLP